MQRAISTIILALLCATIHASAETRMHKLYKASIAVLIAGSAADIGTSMGKYETNPLLRGSDGSFGARGIALKSGIVGGSLAVQWLLRKHRIDSAATAGNFAMAGAYGWIASRNMRYGRIAK